MNSFYRQLLTMNAAVDERNGLFYQTSKYRHNDFEQHYTKLRHQEGRLYPNHVVKGLPAFAGPGSLQKEWQVRKRSAEKLIQYLKKHSGRKILELGCGNGWLTHAIQCALNADCCGVDVNETELLQGVEVFGGNDKLTFLYADIFSDIFESPMADVIIIASAIQYFPDPQKLLKKLLTLLNPEGELHILDSPFYDDHLVDKARDRSKNYFRKSGSPEMGEHYFHHSWDVLSGFSFVVVHDPKTIWNRVTRSLNNNSPFPWVIISG